MCSTPRPYPGQQFKHVLYMSNELPFESERYHQGVVIKQGGTIRTENVPPRPRARPGETRAGGGKERRADTGTRSHEYSSNTIRKLFCLKTQMGTGHGFESITERPVLGCKRGLECYHRLAFHPREQRVTVLHRQQSDKMGVHTASSSRGKGEITYR